ncbi:MAG TPA: cytochrome c, partial [Candidatus Limnocylindrales bacterium]|nr:cytochrome c [Candidatus Limnocylindrales bacterium]
RMALHVVAQAPADFATWLAAQAQPAADPTTAQAMRGREAFLANRCNACHTVRGVSEESRLGPDLTHIGSRPSLGAGTLPNDQQHLAQWIANTQQHKPGARMPSSGERIDAATLESIAAWLSDLR